MATIAFLEVRIRTHANQVKNRFSLWFKTFIHTAAVPKATFQSCFPLQTVAGKHQVVFKIDVFYTERSLWREERYNVTPTGFFQSAGLRFKGTHWNCQWTYLRFVQKEAMITSRKREAPSATSIHMHLKITQLTLFELLSKEKVVIVDIKKVTHFRDRMKRAVE